MARTNTKDKASPRVGDAIALLKADHTAVGKLFKQYNKLCENEDGDDDAKGRLATRICLELTVHATIEEEIFYPALREALDDQALLDEAEVEHASAKDLIGQLEQMEPGDELYDAKVIVLGEYINHHVDEEEGDMFKEARKAKFDMQALGREMLARQAELKAELGIGDDDDAEAEDAPARFGRKSGSRAQNGSHRAA